MKPNPYINISETELIKKYNSFSAPCEESKSILTYLWNNYQSFIVKQCRQYFSTSSYIDFDDILQTCFITFCEVIQTYDSKLGKLTTALSRPLQHTFTLYIADAHGFTQHENLMVTRYATILKENDLSGNEDIHLLTALYNKNYGKTPITTKSMMRYRDYYLMQDMVRLDQYPIDISKPNISQSTDSVWQGIADLSTYTTVRNYIQKTEGNDRLLLLFLFGFIPSIEIEGHLYSVHEKPHPIKPLRKAYDRIFPELSRYLYESACIPDTNPKSLMTFLCNFVALKF